MRTRDENKMDALLQHALTTIVNDGFDGLSMQKLAKAAGVSPATIYIYFKDRDDLIQQLYLRVCDEYFAFVMTGFDPDMDFGTGLTVQWKNRARYQLEHPDEAHFMEHFKFTPLHRLAHLSKHEKFGETMKRFVNKAIGNKELVRMPIEIYWSVAFAPLYNLVRWHKMGVNMTGEPFSLTDEILTQTLALVLKALKPDPAAVAPTTPTTASANRIQATDLPAAAPDNRSDTSETSAAPFDNRSETAAAPNNQSLTPGPPAVPPNSQSQTPGPRAVPANNRSQSPDPPASNT